MKRRTFLKGMALAFTAALVPTWAETAKPATSLLYVGEHRTTRGDELLRHTRCFYDLDSGEFTTALV